MKNTRAHQFALWHGTLSSEKIVNGQQYKVIHKDLITRITSVLRLRVGETFILFDRACHVFLKISSLESKCIVTIVSSIDSNAHYTPCITALLPVLKKDDLSTAVYDLTAVGVSVIQLILTDTVQRVWGGQQEYERLERVMIAAAEQSKNFSVPILREPVPLVSEIMQYKTLLWGDPFGTPFQLAMANLPVSLEQCAVLVGPESDFTFSEREALKRAGCIGCSLTPTILRAHLALTIMAASMRSWYHRP